MIAPVVLAIFLLIMARSHAMIGTHPGIDALARSVGVLAVAGTSLALAMIAA